MSFMDTVKQATRPLHDDAENHRFQRALLKGELTREHYAAWLGQLLLMHRALESQLRAHKASHPAFDAVTDEQYQEPYIIEDLAFYGTDPSTLSPTPGTQATIDLINTAAQQNPISLIGYHYVMEGSNNGNRYIAMSLAKRMDLSIQDGKGLRYLDPYGESQREKWAAFRSHIDNTTFTDDEKAAITKAAEDMFRSVALMSDDMLEPQTA